MYMQWVQQFSLVSLKISFLLCVKDAESRSCTKPVLKCLTLSSTKLQPQSLHPLSTTHMLDFKPLLQSKQHIQNRTQAI